MQDIVHAVIKPELADGFYLDYETRRINWDEWTHDYMRTADSRLHRGSPRLDFPSLSSKVETLLALAETFAKHMALDDTYIGNVEASAD